MADNLTKQLIETVKNKVPLTGGLSIKGYPVMGTLSDMKNFKIEEGVLKLRYGTKTVASFDNKRFYFLKNFEFCGAEVLFGLDYQLCLHAFFENYEGYDFIVRDASQFHKNEMREDTYVIGKTPDNRFITSDAWTLGKLFKSGSQFWAYENQKYIMFFNDHGEIRVIVKDGGFKVHKDEGYIEVDIKDATNRVFDIPPALKADTRNVAPRITGEYRFARVNELGVISELTEPKYLQTWQSVFAYNSAAFSMMNVAETEKEYDKIPQGFTYANPSTGTIQIASNDINYNLQSDYASLCYLICAHSKFKLRSVKCTSTGSSDTGTVYSWWKTSHDYTDYESEELEAGCYLLTRLNPANNFFYLDIPEQSNNDIYDLSTKITRAIFKRKGDLVKTVKMYNYLPDSEIDFVNNFYQNESELVPAQFFLDANSKKLFEVNLQTKLGEAESHAVYANNIELNQFRVPKFYNGDATSSNTVDFYLIPLNEFSAFFEKSKGQLFTFNWWRNVGGDDIEYQLIGEGKVYPIVVRHDGNILQPYCFKTTETPNNNVYKMTKFDTIEYISDFEQSFNSIGDDVTDYKGYFISTLNTKDRFAIWNDNKILGISQRLFVNKNNRDVPVYIDNNAAPNNLLVRYSPVLSLEFMNQRSFRFELPLIRRAIRNPQFLCVSNNYVYEFEDNRLWYGSAYDFMLTGYTYLDGSLLKLIAYNEGVLACTTSGLYYVNRETVQPVVNGRAIRADFAGETQVGGVVIAENKVYIVRTEITDSGARIETANLISEPINELVFNGTIKLTCNKRQLYLADDYNVYGFDTRAGIWNLRYNYGNKRIADIFILDNRLGILFDNEVDAAKANAEYTEPILPS